ncbi:MAG: hypothetical protein MK008_00445 [Bdellovibrionales bacterium]|nr:hypothetical protein [Bdellovibrionales bacterium]
MKYLIILLLLPLVGCVSTSTKTNEKSEFYVKNINAESIEESGGLFSASCPKNKTDLKDKDWNTMLEMANDCVKDRSWSTLNLVADKLSIMAPLSPWGPYYLSLYEEQRSNFDKAHWLIDLALKKTPNFGMLYYQKARIHWSQGNKVEAISLTQKSLELDNRIKSAHFFLANIYLSESEYSKALSHYDYLNKKGISNKNVVLGMAESLYRLNKMKQAQPFLKKSLSVKKNNFDLMLMYAESLEATEDTVKEALNMYKDLYKMSQSNTKYSHKKEHFKMKIDQFDKKIAQLEAAKRDVSSTDNKGGQQ